ncbi:uncharacterized protein [Fopius arisanus]|uniref:Uncharacterized protein n=1 Tax=Fopius arisanus TaxID=64838 RepID=A0A9R1TLY1_9HYME|nr:PREDICTED: uncharacterized protein LOC105271602 [Fopius arisanus]
MQLHVSVLTSSKLKMTPRRSFLVALSILLVGNEALGRTLQGRSGYDLSNGPVTYEAYYPDDAQPLEKTYQTPYPVDNDPLKDNNAPWRESPPVYVNQYRREQTPHTDLEAILKMLIDAIRNERIAPRQVIPQFYHKDVPEGENIFKSRPQVINYLVTRDDEVPQVDAIEVSGKPHKVRHHHGEILRHNLETDK